MSVSITIKQDEDQILIASVPTLPGCWSQGRTHEEAIANIQDAVEGYIESHRKSGNPLPREDFDLTTL